MNIETILEALASHPERVELDLCALGSAGEFDDDGEDVVIEAIEAMPEEHDTIVSAIMEAYCCSRTQTHVNDITQGNVEPGYNDEPFALGDWWVRVDGDLRESKVVQLLTACGVDSAFYDEWTTCTECYKAVRTSPDHYGWKRSYHLFHDCEVVCHECIAEDPEPYLEDLSGDPNKAITIDSVDPEEHGYTEVWAEFENGWYGGQMDSPHAIGRAFEERGWDDYVFSITSVGQFDVKFKVYVRTHGNEGNGEDYEFSGGPFKFVAEVKSPSVYAYGLAEDEDGNERVFDCPDEAAKHGRVYVWPNFSHGETHAEEDPAQAMKRGLEAASRQMAQARETADATGGVVYAKVHTDGSASTRVVSKAEFIAGITD